MEQDADSWRLFQSNFQFIGIQRTYDFVEPFDGYLWHNVLVACDIHDRDTDREV